ncbi:MAG TPA: 1,4-alpha-glucan branching protein GlgB [Burkholderiales bacterium]|nr:1,4-alpha-glucan branching protein GlgB [Burkholderiales bacterium]
MKHDLLDKVNPLRERLLQGRLHDPFAYLGLHRDAAGCVVRVYQPHALHVELATSTGFEAMRADAGVFEWRGVALPPLPYRLRVDFGVGAREMHDPYAFKPAISADELYLFNEGRLYQAYRTLGARPATRDGVAGYRFAVWAPNAERVSVVGEFNRWDGRVHPMAVHGASGVWELFIPGVAPGTLYKFEIRSRQDGSLRVKTDPYAQACELRPGTAGRLCAPARHAWGDGEWMARRARWDWLHAPISIYEVHAGSWMRHPDGRFYDYRELAEQLVPYVLEMGYTHVELLPLTEHPLDESWGYQSTGYFAATSRYGDADALRGLIDACHRAGIGVILDWVPGHFPQDAFALARYDGTALYEHDDPRLGLHQDWGTHIFNFARNEVKSFLISSAHYWLSEFHVDGLRVDAVASMLYLDYSRKAGEWLPNRYGGRENLEAIEFLRALNIVVHDQFPGALTLAEESTAWPGVSRPVYLGGLGFSMKWNMGWMNDTLAYMQRDPVHRRYHHTELTFGQLYAYSENFVLPFSHDEVVHGKHSLLDKMPGDAWQRFANVRLLATYQMTSPGKKLNFMGNEFAQGREWRVAWELDWHLLAFEAQRGVQAAVRDLNRLYRSLPALHDLDVAQEGFAWIDCHDADHSTLVFQRRARNGELVVVALNFTPVPRLHYRIGVPAPGAYREVFNSDSHHYGGSNVGNLGERRAEDQPWMGQPCSIEIALPPLGGIILAPSPPTS